MFRVNRPLSIPVKYFLFDAYQKQIFILWQQSDFYNIVLGPRGATIFFGVVGLVFAAAVIIPPVYVHETDQVVDQVCSKIEESITFSRKLTIRLLFSKIWKLIEFVRKL
jgi:ABC-type molybdate transport system permease subunit